MSSLIVTGILACALAVAPPEAVEHHPEETRFPMRVQCTYRMLEIGKRLQLFTLARDGKFPSALSEVFADGSTESVRNLVCPATRATVVSGHLVPSYAYAILEPGGRVADDGPDDVVLFDARPVHENGRNVLFSDMSTVKYVEESAFQKLLAEQEQKWRKQGRTLRILWDDRVPLTELQERALARGGRPLLHSAYFWLSAGIVVAIAVVLALLILQSRKPGTVGEDLTRQGHADTIGPDSNTEETP